MMAKDNMLPLEGFRVVDLTQVWAGPLCVQLLADFGADVIRIDSRERAAEQAAATLRRRGESAAPTPDPRLGYSSLFRNRRPLTLDLTKPEGRRIVKELAAKSDVLVENFSSRVMRNWGLSFAELSRINPNLIMISLSPAGHHGPWADVLSYGPSLNALFGAKSLLGYPNDPAPMEDMSEADPIAGIYGFLGVLVALQGRERGNGGCHIDMAQGEALLVHATEAFLDEQLGIPPPRGNRHSAMAPHGIFRASGNDEWISIATETDEQWASLCALMGHPELASRFPTVDERLANQDEIEEALETWSKSQDANALTERLSELGIPALPVINNPEQVTHPHLVARRGEGLLPPPEIAKVSEIGNAMPIKLSVTPAALRSPEASFVEPQPEVLEEVLGYSKAQIESLISESVI